MGQFLSEKFITLSLLNNKMEKESPENRHYRLLATN